MLPVLVVEPSLLVYVPDNGSVFVYVFLFPMDVFDNLTKAFGDIEDIFHRICIQPF
jgi:hypothetical protein